MNKKGQIFPIFLVFLTLLMCGSVMFLYFHNQDKVSASLVSPKAVLEIGDDVKTFELQEKHFINNSLGVASASEEFGTKEFLDSFRDAFFRELINNPDSFITEGIFMSGTDVSLGASKNTEAFFKNALYPAALTYYEGKNLHFGRASIEKRTRLQTDEKLKNNFAVDFSFNFDNKYLISKKGNNFIVEEE